MAVKTFYPDADPETTSVDGPVWQTTDAGDTFANLCAAAGTNSDDDYWGDGIGITSHTDLNKWKIVSRTIVLFDTSSLPDNCTITSAVVSVCGYRKTDTLNITPDINIYSSAPASNTALASGDFDSLGSTPFCDTPITYANWDDDDGWNTFTLNAAGLAAISKTGITKFGFRNANYDVAGVTPAWSSNKVATILFYLADLGVSTAIPKLTVYYTPVETVTPHTKTIVTLEAIRNFEMATMGRFYIDEEGNAKFEDRYARNP